MNWDIKRLKGIAGAAVLGSSLLLGLAQTTNAQDPYDYSRHRGNVQKRHQKEEKRELKLHQRLERQEFGNSAELRRHQKEEQRQMKRHQKREKRFDDWRYRY